MTPEELEQIKAMVVNLIGESRRTRIVAQEDTRPPKEVGLYLISLHSPSLAFPDDRGRAILCQCVYGRVALRKGEGFYGGEVEVVAYGDGKRLTLPLKAFLTGANVVGLVEVGEEMLNS